ncbi:MAG: GNAT family N-acetyltransferase [Sandaracinaceae bacterium]|nr:GNAT family N-acetyltransferase [Sandaracinaceae bacterium]
MTLRFEDAPPDLESLIALYGSVGWKSYLRHPERAMRGVRASTYVTCAWEEDRLIGMARTISDDATIWLLQDLLVHPDHQGRGLGAALIARAEARHADVPRGLLLTDASGPTGFYERVGWHQDARIATFLRGR